MMSSLFGSSTPQTNFTPKGFTNPQGFGVTGFGTVQQSPTLTSNIGSLSSTFGQQAGAISNLASTVAPGFSQFRQAGLADITSTFQAARSNLSDNLALRKVAGSSFANSAFSQTAADEAQTKANFEATSYLQELQQFNQLQQEQYQAATQQYSTYINQSNIESATAAQLTQSNNQIMASIAQANTQLQAQSQAGAGKFLGTVAGAGIGFALGGPAGALAGASIGGGALGGGYTTGPATNLSGLNSQPFGGFFSAAPTSTFPTSPTSPIPFTGQ